MEGNKKINIKNIIIMCGAFISYTVGAGFASGNEVLQFFGSWGDKSVIAVSAGLIVTAIYCVCLCLVGRCIDLKKQSDIYIYFGGKGLGRLFQLTVFIFLMGNVIMMFSGAGSLLQQQWGFPQWVGAALMGIVAAVIVIGGLNTVESVLGNAGIIILIYVVIFGIISVIQPGASLGQAAGAEEAVKAGKIFQANVWAVPPFSIIPGLSELNTSWLEGIIYGSVCLVSGFPFYLSLGRRCSKHEAPIAGIAVAVSFYLCVSVSLVMMLLNFNALTNPLTEEMYAIPVLAVINSMWPSGSWTYVLIIFTGIFTSEAGYLWAVNDMFFKGKEKTLKSRGFVVGLIIFGVFFGSRIPLSMFFQYLHPFTGMIGFLMVVSILVKTIKVMKEHKLGKEMKGAEIGC